MASDDGLSIGSVLDGRYRIDGVLGSGGMGRVYRGEHTGLGRAVAIKVLHADLGSNREAVTRFQREALASGRMEHPNIVAVSDFGELPDGAAFLVMEALDGEPLGARLDRGRLPWREALAILRGVLAGLAHAHERGVVHRDIKPDNVFLTTKDGELLVKVLDFGIAKLFAGDGDDPATTRQGLTIGTPAYLSPEQAVGGAITPATDLYSSTVVLFEMLTGRAPFECDDALQMLGAHATAAPPSLREIAPDLELPDGLEDLVKRGLAKRAAERVSSALAYLGEIDAMTGAPPVIDHDSKPVIVPVRRDSRPIATNDALAATAATEVDTPAVIGQAPTLSMTPWPLAARAVTLDDVARTPVPRSWIVIAGAIAGAAVLLAIVLAIAGGGGSHEVASAAPADAAVVAKPAAVAAAKPAPIPAKPAPPPKPVDLPPAPVEDKPPVETPAQRDAKLKALFKQLDAGRTCAERRAAIPKLVALGDARAVGPLKAARVRKRGGVFGIGAENVNGCLYADADAAAKKLAPK